MTEQSVVAVVAVAWAAEPLFRLIATVEAERSVQAAGMLVTVVVSVISRRQLCQAYYLLEYVA